MNVSQYFWKVPRELIDTIKILFLGCLGDVSSLRPCVILVYSTCIFVKISLKVNTEFDQKEDTVRSGKVHIWAETINHSNLEWERAREINKKG